ncbi:TPA: iron-sulfur cluster assembly accessory protein [archaeon]|uniref:Iron-sulfur cluster assembly accessory protein n=1 Tax=Candidatus Naiadarchaeum limnaeum TaxID=2756139 RepID=A0A832V567_9ARCH|nr:iron-sulfur cluster assembly accessory protein [Candidatus Naiadarchaeales archaeon SRR2090153.bin1042]HIK00465.1 iron-sulfur cluster assembly accessory protein [Candidatus Naiadarchaeum limnaeum]
MEPKIQQEVEKVTITDFAVEKVKAIMQRENKADYGLRIRILPGGCAGFTYDFVLDKNQAADDVAIEKSGLKVIVDKFSLSMMKNAVIDYVESLQGSGFKVNNENFKSSCGCGDSHG